MTRYQDVEAAFLDKTLVEALRFRCEDAGTVEAAAQRLCSLVYETFPTSVLVRVFAAVALERLPSAIQRQVSALAAALEIAPALKPTTPVFTLLGTRGKLESWNDRRMSAQHFGLPLISSEFVAAIPMMSRLLEQLGLDLKWLDDATPKAKANVAGIFHTEDAKAATDAAGRLVIPARDFVDQHDVQTVFGVGGTYRDGTLLSLICFTAEHIPHAAGARYLPLFLQFRASTAAALERGRIFG